MRLSDSLKNELRKETLSERYDVTQEGIYFPRNGINFSGEYFGRVNGGEWTKESDNLVVTEGLIHILNVALGSTSKPAGYFLALFSGGAAPAANWTAASFSAAASEITSQSEGYTSATRPGWTPANASGTAQVDNFSSAAQLTIATASSLNVTGAALLTSNQRGGTTGALISASAFPVTRTFQVKVAVQGGGADEPHY